MLKSGPLVHSDWGGSRGRNLRVKKQLTLGSHGVFEIRFSMLRHAGLDAPGTIHHVIGRGIIGTKAGI